MEKKVWQGRPDGCFSVAPGLVFNFRWASPSLSERGRKSVKSIFSPKWGQKARERWRWEGEGEKRGRSNKPDSGREEVWKWRLGREKLCSWAARHVPVIMSPPFLSRSCLYYLHSRFSAQISCFKACGDNDGHLCHPWSVQELNGDFIYLFFVLLKKSFVVSALCDGSPQFSHFRN